MATRIMAQIRELQHHLMLMLGLASLIAFGEGVVGVSAVKAQEGMLKIPDCQPSCQR